MSVDAAKLVKWFQQRPVWLQTAAHRLIVNQKLTPDDLREFTAICRAESIAEKGGSEAPPLSAAVFALTASGKTIRLTSLSNVKGIEALAPRVPLTFVAETVTIVYGLNGAGKSGYIRILNNVCGSKNRRKLLGNVFQAPSDQSCTIGYSVNGEEKQLAWTPAHGEQSELAGLEIYDAECGHVYITAENEVAYEPWLLGLFQQLVDACEAVDRALAAEIAALPSAKPAFPVDLAATAASDWYGKLNAQTKLGDVAGWCDWPQERQNELDALNTRLLQKNPADEAKVLRTRKTGLVRLANDLTDWNARLNASAVAALLTTKKDADTTRKAAAEDAAAVFAGAPLQGVGQESWKLLWEQARAYSEVTAYPGKPFPVTEGEARCLLCQQPLAADARTRLVSFEAFVKGELEQLAKTAETKWAGLRDGLPEIPTEAVFNERLATLILDDEAVAKAYRLHREALQTRRDAILAGDSAEKIPLAPTDEAVTDLTTLADTLETQAQAFDADAKKGDKTELKKAAREMEACKWLSEQKAAVEAEVGRLQKVAALEEARRLTNTTALSSKKAELSQALVSDAFIARFQAELRVLSAARLQVELVQTRTTKGHVYHQLRLRNAKIRAPMSEVLSEGERRVVSLAAFLADVGGIEASTPFVFDDPISSLDQDYEESVVARLVGLAKTRQVIVFTHRLSFLTLLETALEATGAAVRVVGLYREPWGSGQPGDTPFPARKPKAALNGLIDSVNRARNVLNDTGTADYEMHAKSICRNTRIMLERLVEETLLNGVVLRFRRSVQTDNRIAQLGKIQPADCKLIDDMMTKYSRYEHSQSKEAPVPLPPPDEIAADLVVLQRWYKAFTDRPIP